MNMKIYMKWTLLFKMKMIQITWIFKKALNWIISYGQLESLRVAGRQYHINFSMVVLTKDEMVKRVLTVDKFFILPFSQEEKLHGHFFWEALWEDIPDSVPANDDWLRYLVVNNEINYAYQSLECKDHVLKLKIWIQMAITRDISWYSFPKKYNIIKTRISST